MPPSGPDKFKGVDRTQLGVGVSSMLDKLDARVHTEKPIVDACNAVIEAKKLLASIDFKAESADILQKLSSPWTALQTDKFAGSQLIKDFLNLYAPGKENDNETRKTLVAKFARQIWRTEITEFIIKKLAESERSDAAQVAGKILAGQKVTEKQDEPIEQLNAAMFLDPAFSSRQKRQALGQEMAVSTMSGDVSQFLGQFSVRINHVKVLTGGAFLEIPYTLTGALRFKNIVFKREENRIYALMENGCKGNLVIMETESAEASAPEPAPAPAIPPAAPESPDALRDSTLGTLDDNSLGIKFTDWDGESYDWPTIERNKDAVIQAFGAIPAADLDFLKKTLRPSGKSYSDKPLVMLGTEGRGLVLDADNIQYIEINLLQPGSIKQILETAIAKLRKISQITQELKTIEDKYGVELRFLMTDNWDDIIANKDRYLKNISDALAGLIKENPYALRGIPLIVFWREDTGFVHDKKGNAIIVVDYTQQPADIQKTVRKAFDQYKTEQLIHMAKPYGVRFVLNTEPPYHNWWLIRKQYFPEVEKALKAIGNEKLKKAPTIVLGYTNGTKTQGSDKQSYVEIDYRSGKDNIRQTIETALK